MVARNGSDVGIVDAIRDELQRTVRSRPQHIDRAKAVEIGRAVARHVAEYRRMRRLEDNEAAKAVQTWVLKTAERVEGLSQWILQGPACPCGRSYEVGAFAGHECASSERLNGAFFNDLDEARMRVGPALDNFRQWLDMHYSGEPWPSHRPADPTREDLELDVAFELHTAGVRLRTGPDGVLGRVLAAVYEEVGIDSTTDGAVIRIFKRHPEWRA